MTLTHTFLASNGKPTRDTHMLFADRPVVREQAQILAMYVGTFRQPTAKLAAVLRDIGYYDIPEEVMHHMRTRKPRVENTDLWKRTSQFVEDAVAATAPLTPYPAGILQSTAAGFVEWAILVQHLPLDGSVLFSRQLIDMYVNDKYSHLSEGTRRNYRAQLDRISKVLVPEEHPYEYSPLNRKVSANPYTPAELTQFRMWAAGQSRPEKRRRGITMLTLCTGAGLRSSEVGMILPEHVTVTNAGILINVPSTTPRQVPLLDAWDEWMLSLLETAEPGTPLWGPTKRKDKTNLLSTFVENAEGEGPRGDRLRHTWLVWHLNNRTPMKDLFYAAGVRKMEHLGRLILHCEDLSEANYLAVLSGKAVQ